MRWFRCSGLFSVKNQKVGELMKKSFIFILLMLVFTMFGGCNKAEPTIYGSWYTQGTVHGLDYNTVDVYLNFLENSQGNITTKHPDNKEVVFIFEYIVNNNNLVITSSEGKELDANSHIYPFKIEENTLIIEVSNETHKYTRNNQGGN